MEESSDWVIAESAQKDIQSFAAITWKLEHLARCQKNCQVGIEGLEDVLTEMSLAGSWLRFGDSFNQIVDEASATSELEKRMADLEEKLAISRAASAELESDKKTIRTRIHAALGDAAYLGL